VLVEAPVSSSATPTAASAVRRARDGTLADADGAEAAQCVRTGRTLDVPSARPLPLRRGLLGHAP
jgi:hypothetical protein